MDEAIRGYANQADRSPSRVEQDVGQIKTMTEHVERTTERIIRHAHMLGYFEPPSDAKTPAPTPVVTTMSDAISELSRAIDHCSGALNVFD